MKCLSEVQTGLSIWLEHNPQQPTSPAWWSTVQALLPAGPYVMTAAVSSSYPSVREGANMPCVPSHSSDLDVGRRSSEGILHKRTNETNERDLLGGNSSRARQATVAKEAGVGGPYLSHHWIHTDCVVAGRIAGMPTGDACPLGLPSIKRFSPSPAAPNDREAVTEALCLIGTYDPSLIGYVKRQETEASHRLALH